MDSTDRRGGAMSGYLQGQVWFRDVRGSERDVLLAMADHAHDDGTHVFPAMDYLAWKVGVSKRQAQRIVSGLRERGALVVVREATRYEPTHYRLELAALPPKAEFERAEAEVTPASPLPVRGDKSGASGVTNRARRGDIQMSPESSRETSKETSAVENACARKVELPEGFPDELRPHLKAVYRVLRDLAARHEAREVKPIALANVVMARPRKPLVRAAHDFAAWADGRARTQKDVVAGYRNWLNREDSLAAIEGLSESGVPVGPATRSQNGNGRPVGLLESQVWPDGRTWPELTAGEQYHAKDAAARGLKPWLPPEEHVAVMAGASNGNGNGNGNGRGYTAQNFADDD